MKKTTLLNEVKNLLKSRTILVLLFLVAYNVFEETSDILPASVSAIINVALTALAGYYRINPKQKF